MAWRSHALLVALALASTTLAGCIENPLSALTTDTEVSAFENKALADREAAKLGDVVELIGVTAFELTQSEDQMIMPDPEVGNGLAPAWWYVYCIVESSDTEKTADEEASSFRKTGESKVAAQVTSVRAFKVTADGTVTSEDDAAAMAAGYEHDMVEKLDDWEIDSTVALSSAKADETFRQVVEGFNASLIQGVAEHEGQTAWWFAAMSADGFVVATVDAKTGELLEVMPFDMDMTIPSFEWGARDPQAWAAEPVILEGEGVAEPGGEPLVVPFSAASEMHGTLVIVFDDMLPMDALHWEILDRDGDSIAGDHVSSWRSGGSYEAEVELEDAGDYTFVLYHMSEVPMPLGSPLSQGVAYTFVLELMPGEAEHDDEDHR